MERAVHKHYDHTYFVSVRLLINPLLGNGSNYLTFFFQLIVQMYTTIKKSRLPDSTAGNFGSQKIFEPAELKNGL